MKAAARARRPRCFMFLVAMTVFFSTVPAEACVMVPSPPQPVGPIFINGDSMFLGNPAVAGGSGTPDDPYRIENLVLERVGQAGICLLNTNASLLIRNVTVNFTEPLGGYSANCGRTGIYLANVKNARVVGATVLRAGGGITLDGVVDVTLENVTIEGGDPGIQIDDSLRVKLAGTRLTNSTIEIGDRYGYPRGSPASFDISEDNLIDGLPFWYRANCADITLEGRAVAGVFIANCTGVDIVNVSMPGERAQLRVYDSSDVTVDSLVGGLISLKRVNFAWVKSSVFNEFVADSFTYVQIEDSRSPDRDGTTIEAVNGTYFRVAGNSFDGFLQQNPVIQLGAPPPSPPPSGCNCYSSPATRKTVDQALIENNTFEGWGRQIIRVLDAPGAVVSGNLFANATSAIAGYSQPGLLVKDNIILGGGTEYAAIAVSGPGSVVKNNTLRGVAIGVSTVGAQGLEITGNTINSTRAGLELGLETEYKVEDNHLEGGALQALQSPNWWEITFELGPNNTVNGLPFVFDRECLDVTYDAVALGAIWFIDCANVRLANLSFSDVTEPMVFMGVEHFSIENVLVENATAAMTFQSVWDGSVVGSHLNRTKGVEMFDAANLSFRGNVIENGSGGFLVSSAGGIVLEDNRVEGSQYGPFYAYKTYDLTLGGNAFAGGGISLAGTERDHFTSHHIDPFNTVNGKPLLYLPSRAGLTVEDQPLGQLIVVNSTDIDLRRLDISGNGTLIQLAFVDRATISNVTLSSGGGDALSAEKVDGLAISDSAFTALPRPGWFANGAGFNTVSNVRIERATFNGSGGRGIFARAGSNWTVMDCTFTHETGGAYFDDIRNLEVSRISVSGQYGGVYFYRIENGTMTDSQFRQGYGAQLITAQNFLMAGNRFEDLAGAAIVIEAPSNTTVRDNVILRSAIGLSLRGGSQTQNVRFEGNLLQANDIAIYLAMRDSYRTPSILVVNNTVEGNNFGALGNFSVGITFVHNRFLNNTVQARVADGATWDGGYLVGGNFWSDYNGADACSGANQDVCPDADQFGDAAYCLGAPAGRTEAFDRYPLMTQTAPPARQPPPPPVQPPTPTTLDPIGAGLPAIALILAILAVGVFLSMRRKPIEKLEEEEIERLS